MRARHSAWLAVGPGVLVAAQFVLLATGKPAEYARFSLTLDLLLVIGLAAVIAKIRPRMPRVAVMIVLPILVGGSGLNYVEHFYADRPPASSRLQAAGLIAATSGTVFIDAEPAPYCLPPVNLFDRPIVLLPPNFVGALPSPGVRVRAVDRTPGGGWSARLGWTGDAPIAWANKPFAVDCIGDESPTAIGRKPACPYNPAD